MKFETKLKLLILTIPLLIVGCASIQASQNHDRYVPVLAVIDADTVATREGVDLPDAFESTPGADDVLKSLQDASESIEVPNIEVDVEPDPEPVKQSLIDNTFREGLTALEYIAAFYKRPWTHPGPIEPHLMSHSVPIHIINSLSNRDRERLHAAIHEREEGNSRLIQVTKRCDCETTGACVCDQCDCKNCPQRSTIKLAANRVQNCPNGQCPAPNNSFRIIDGSTPQPPTVMAYQNCPNGQCPAPTRMSSSVTMQRTSGNCANYGKSYSSRRRSVRRSRSGPIRRFFGCLFGRCR